MITVSLRPGRTSTGESLNRGMDAALERVQHRLNRTCCALRCTIPSGSSTRNASGLADLEDRMGRIMERRVTAGRHRLAMLADVSSRCRLWSRSAAATDSSPTAGENGWSPCSQVKPGDRITVRVRDGRAVARVEETESLDDRKGGELT